MPTPVSKIKVSLTKKGFVEEEGKKHKRWVFFYKGKRTSAYFFLSRTPKMKDFDDSLLSYAKNELQLKTNSEVRQLWECSMDHEKYIEKLKEYGVISGE